MASVRTVMSITIYHPMMTRNSTGTIPIFHHHMSQNLRERIKEEYGLEGIGEVSKKAGELWKEMTESEKVPWEEKNREAKEVGILFC